MSDGSETSNETQTFSKMLEKIKLIKSDKSHGTDMSLTTITT